MRSVSPGLPHPGHEHFNNQDRVNQSSWRAQQPGKNMLCPEPSDWKWLTPPTRTLFVSLHWFSWLMLLLRLHSSAAFSSSTYSQHHALSQPVFMTSICICVWEICSVKNKGHLIIWFSVPGPPLQISPINVICKCMYSCHPVPPLKTLNWSPLIRPPNSAQTA